MNRILRLVTTFAVIIITLVIVRDYGFTELLTYTGLIWLVINLLTEIVLSIVLKKKYDKRDKYASFVEGELFECRDELANDREVALKQAKEIDNYNKMFEQQKKKDLLRISLGDTVTPVNYQKTSKVYAMKYEDVTWYQLRKGGKWYTRNEIRKVEKTN